MHNRPHTDAAKAKMSAATKGKPRPWKHRPTKVVDGVLRYRERWVSLPPVEARIAEALAHRFGGVVRRETLTAAGWPDDPPSRNALDVHVLRLRRRIEPLELVIRTVRSRGYLLEGAGQPAYRLTASAAARTASGSPR